MLSNFAQTLFTKHKTRMWLKEKAPFLAYCQEEFKALGYDEIQVMPQKNCLDKTSHNFVVGRPDAEIIFTAHYDTPARNGMLLLLAPIFGLLLGGIITQLPLIIIPFFISSLPSIFTNINGWLLLALNLLFVLFMVAIFVVKNPHNHNDNTSGVIGVYKMAQILADKPELRDRCAFILFDHEEVLPGLVGSRAFAKWRKIAHHNSPDPLVINFDCIGVGDVLTIMTKKKHDHWTGLAQFMEDRGMKIKKMKSGIGLSGTSDHASFSRGVSFLYQKRSLLGPLYMPKIHTGRDKICNLEQIEELATAVYEYIDK